MSDNPEEAAISSLPLQKKLDLGTGATFWTTNPAPALGIPALTLTDGPHGLRGQGEDGDHLGIKESMVATCFPTSSALACSWDTGLLAAVGEAIGLEAVDQQVHVVLGPGVNMKRNPLCGRNFEYFSEDPLLAGKLAAAWITGVQGTGTGTSLKHFALNNQELKRMTTDVRVDDRALHEYYLPAFEIAVKEANPTTVMSAYNRVEGVYCSEHPRLLTDILRRRWGFGGVVVTDWGGINDRAASYAAGLDLEMPGNGGASNDEVRSAIEDGRLDTQCVDTSVERMRGLARRVRHRGAGAPEDLYERNHQLARRAAVESAVLLKNDDDALPLPGGESIALLGALAESARYQGTGSSRVNPTRVTDLRSAMEARAEIRFAAGYRLSDEADEDLLAEALAAAELAERVVVCAGLTDTFESEGFDREHMRIPANQVKLLEALAPFSHKVTIVLVGGSAVEMPWEGSAAAILHMHLAGQAGGEAAADLLFGTENPSGRLAETYPISYDDVVSAGRFGVEAYQTPYLESMYCGYRYFDSAQVPVRFPFGHGLSYTTFTYSDLRVTSAGEHDLDLTLTVSNTGARAGAEVVQVYISPRTGGAYRPVQELKAFTKVHLAAGESRTVPLHLDRRSFAIFDPSTSDWMVEAGAYEIRIGASSREIRLTKTVDLTGEEPRRGKESAWYRTPRGKPAPADFLTIHEPFPHVEPPQKGTFDLNSSILEMKESSLACRIMHYAVERTVAKSFGGRVDYSNPHFKMLMYSAAGLPMRAMIRMSDGVMSPALARFFIESANGRTVRGLWGLIRGRA